MKSKFLLTGLISILLSGVVYADDGFHNVAAAVGAAPAAFGSNYFPTRRNFGHFRPQYNRYNPYYNRFNRFNPFYRNNFSNGVLTGFSPPVAAYYPNGVYSYNDGVTQNTYLTGGNGFSLKNWFNQRFNPNYYRQNLYVPQNPYVNGNYNNLQNQKSIQLFGTGNNGAVDPYGNAVNDGTNSGCNVTIID